MEAFLALNSTFDLEFFHSDSYLGDSSDSAPPTTQHLTLPSDYLSVPVPLPIRPPGAKSNSSPSYFLDKTSYKHPAPPVDLSRSTCGPSTSELGNSSPPSADLSDSVPLMNQYHRPAIDHLSVPASPPIERTGVKSDSSSYLLDYTTLFDLSGSTSGPSSPELRDPSPPSAHLGSSSHSAPLMNQHHRSTSGPTSPLIRPPGAKSVSSPSYFFERKFVHSGARKSFPGLH